MIHERVIKELPFSYRFFLHLENIKKRSFKHPDYTCSFFKSTDNNIEGRSEYCYVHTCHYNMKTLIGFTDNCRSTSSSKTIPVHKIHIETLEYEKVMEYGRLLTPIYYEEFLKLLEQKKQ